MAIMKADRLASLVERGRALNKGKTLAVMKVCGGLQSFNAVNQMRILGHWMRLITILNQSSDELLKRVNQRSI